MKRVKAKPFTLCFSLRRGANWVAVIADKHIQKTGDLIKILFLILSQKTLVSLLTAFAVAHPGAIIAINKTIVNNMLLLKTIEVPHNRNYLLKTCAKRLTVLSLPKITIVSKSPGPIALPVNATRTG